MSARWIRVPPGRREEAGAWLAAGLAAAGVGVVTFYLTRLLLSREPLESTGLTEPRRSPSGEIEPDEGGA